MIIPIIINLEFSKYNFCSDLNLLEFFDSKYNLNFGPKEKELNLITLIEIPFIYPPE